MLLQFEQDDGQIGILKGNQVMARQCLINTLKQEGTPGVPSKRKREEKSPSIMSVYEEEHTPNTQERPRLVEEHEEVEIFEGKSIKIGKNLSEAVRHDVLATIDKFCDIFAFSMEEMSGIPPSIMCHKLDLKYDYKLVKKSATSKKRENGSCQRRSREIVESRIHPRMQVF